METDGAMNSRNPYHVEGEEPKLLRSVVVFMDILGYKEMIHKSTSLGTQQELLTRLHRILTEERSMLEDKQLPSHSLFSADKEFYALKAFTDNIVIGGR
jgi:hypothetical protein